MSASYPLPRWADLVLLPAVCLLVALLAAAGVVPSGQFDAMGFHTGSLIGTELARSRPERVRRLVVFGLAAYPAEVRAAKLAGLLQNFPPPADNLDHVEKLWGIIQTLSDPRMSAEEKHVNMAECLRLGTRMPWGYVSVYRYDFLGAMAEVTQPVLIMNPDDDLGAVTNAALSEMPSGRVRIGGLVVTRQHPMTAKGTVFLALEDETGMVNVTLWPDTWARLRGVVRRNALLLVDGHLQREGSVVNVIAREVQPLPEVAAVVAGPGGPDGVRQLGHAGMRRLA